MDNFTFSFMVYPHFLYFADNMANRYVLLQKTCTFKHESCFFWPMCRLEVCLRVPHILTIAFASSEPRGTQTLFLYLPFFLEHLLLRYLLRYILFHWLYSPLEPWPLLSVSWSFYRRQDSLDEWSARRKTATYTQDNTSTEWTHTHTKHPCLVRDSNPRSQLPNERRQFIP
jgi:hypothetical protein